MKTFLATTGHGLARTSRSAQTALFIQNSSWRDEDSSSHRQIHLTHEMM